MVIGAKKYKNLWKVIIIDSILREECLQKYSTHRKMVIPDRIYNRQRPDF